MVTLGGLFVYPVKSCRGTALERAVLTSTGLQHDREWMVVTPAGRFLTQRDTPRLALVVPGITDGRLVLTAPGMPELNVPLAGALSSPLVEVTVFDDRCLARDEGDGAATWLGEFLGREARLVRFDPSRARATDPAWSKGLAGESKFADGYPLLVLARASLDDLNARLPAPLPVDRFRPNLLLDGCEPYAEDRIDTLRGPGFELRLVKPCTRCSITTTDQATAVVSSDEPLRTLRTYRWDKHLRGVTFGQNAIIVAGAGQTLERGMPLKGEPLPLPTR
jgi:uncharacterized protein YcbX